MPMNEYRKDDKYVCVECGGPCEPERNWPKPGITRYKPCPRCGAIGVCPRLQGNAFTSSPIATEAPFRFSRRRSRLPRRMREAGGGWTLGGQGMKEYAPHQTTVQHLPVPDAPEFGRDR